MSNKYSELKDMLLGKFEAEEIEPLDLSTAESFSFVEPEAPEMVSHPAHYNYGKYETIDVIEDWGLGFHCGNAIKYISRHKHKGTATKDIKKAIWYLKRYLETMED
tara:strand:- start:248 stop:565 length:318 start_codon:yes stop_codon:yes gene_type:complete